MIDHWIPIDDDADIKQGDIIRRRSTRGDGQDAWGTILTADCDIAQNKTGDRYTWLEIIRSQHYLETHWATEQLRRIAEKHCISVCENINRLLRDTGHDLADLTPSSLRLWLAESTPEQIIQKIDKQKSKSNSALLQNVSALRISLGYESYPNQLVRLQTVWTIMGRGEKAQHSAIRDAFSHDRGFPDSLLIPELPRTAGYGFVILLRSISTLPINDLYKTEIDARVDGRSNAFHRIGRFSDALRFSVAQKLAFLFSRIGMTTQFEMACEAATDLLVEGLYQKQVAQNDR